VSRAKGPALRALPSLPVMATLPLETLEQCEECTDIDHQVAALFVAIEQLADNAKASAEFGKEAIEGQRNTALRSLRLLIEDVKYARASLGQALQRNRPQVASGRGDTRDHG
jgi:hypothetical protein